MRIVRIRKKHPYDTRMTCIREALAQCSFGDAVLAETPYDLTKAKAILRKAGVRPCERILSGEGWLVYVLPPASAIDAKPDAKPDP